MWKPEHRHAADRGLHYPSDLTDAEWALVKPVISPVRRGQCACVRQSTLKRFADLNAGKRTSQRELLLVGGEQSSLAPG